MRTLLIDADILVVSTCAASEKEIDWGDDQWTLTSDIKAVKQTILDTIDNIKSDLDGDKVVLCLSRGLNFRHDIYPPYKSGRGRKPIGTGEVKRWLEEEHGAKIKEGIEADDTLGIMATHPEMIPGEKIIVSADKDLLTIPGLVYHGGELKEISPEEADFNWLKQTLMGDVTDGYPGCKGVGPVSAEKILRKEDDKTPWERVVAAYEKAGFDEEYALVQARCARILRWTDYDFATKRVKLWSPS